MCWLHTLHVAGLTSALSSHFAQSLSFLCWSLCNLSFEGSKVYLLLSPFNFQRQSFFLCHYQPLSDPFHLSLPSFLSSRVFTISFLPPILLLSHHFPFLFLLVCLKVFSLCLLTSTSYVCLSGYINTHVFGVCLLLP